MQKVIVVKVQSSLSEKEISKEMDLPEINKLMSEGYKLVNFHQILDNGTSCIVMTFILEKV